MTFYWPHAFWFLLVPLALLLRDLLRRRGTRSAASLPKVIRAEAGRSSLVITASSSRIRAGSPRVRIFVCLGLVAATLALARPQWGRLEEPVFDQAREIIIALDLSRSMLTEDVKPSRLERARLLITSLLEKLKGERVGLIVFSGTAFLQSPLSADYEILREFLPILDPGYLPEGGTNYDALLDTTLSAFGTSGAADRFLIVLSDGEAGNDTWKRHLDTLKTKGIRVLGLGIGTTDGAMIPDGSGAFIKDDRGAVVLSKLTSRTLRELSEKTDGVYTDASSWVDLSRLIETTVEQGRQGAFEEKSRVRLAERFQWPLAAAVVFFLLGFWREFPVRPKPRAMPLAASSVKTAASILLLASAVLPRFSANAAEPAPDLAAPVTQLVGRLAAQENLSAKDYADFARATATYGETARASQSGIPEGSVRDALAAVEAGQALDPKAADWSALRTQLEALLPQDTPPPPKQEQPKPDEKKPEQNKGDKNESSEDQNGQKGESAESGEPQKQEGDSSQDSSSEQSPSQDSQSQGDSQPSDSDADSSSGQPSDDAQKPDTPGQSAFGKMNDEQTPAEGDQPGAQPDSAQPAPDQSPSESEDMQQVGGAQASPSTDPARLDPSLAIPLQKLDQIKQGDSPARLYQLLNEPSSEQPAPAGQTW